MVIDEADLKPLLRLAKTLSDAAVKATLHVYAPHRLAADKRAAIVSLATSGMGMRAIARELGISKATVDRYFPRDAKCPCGRLLVDHRGWCSVRFAASEVRQEAFRKISSRWDKKATGED